LACDEELIVNLFGVSVHRGASKANGYFGFIHGVTVQIWVGMSCWRTRAEGVCDVKRLNSPACAAFCAGPVE
jgi:hypothetical protein